MQADDAMQRLLICNADDFGMGQGIVDATIDCHREGIITSTTLMAHMPAAEYAVRRAREVPNLAVGVHLTLTEGTPLSATCDVPDLVGPDGCFWDNATQCRRLRLGSRLASQVELEFSAQIKHAIDLGVRPTHCDSHHGIHKMPVVRAAMGRVLRRFGIRGARASGGYYWCAPNASRAVRLECCARNLRHAPKELVHRWNRLQLRLAGIHLPDRKVRASHLLPACTDEKRQLLAALVALAPGASEMVFHPGYEDPAVCDSPRFAAVRRSDTRLVRDPELAKAIQRAGIRLISFADLCARR